MSTHPPLVVRLIGIGQYTNYPGLRAEGDTNVDDLHDFLQKEYSGGANFDIKPIKDATKETIIDELRSLRSPLDRTKAIVIFFSGFGGRTSEGTSIICPADIGRTEKSKGITDQELSQLFDTISKFRGNNITLILDCPSAAFNWGWPHSFVVVAPQSVPKNRKAFTTALIDALRLETGSMSSLTVQSFAAKIHAFMPDGIEIDCHGRQVDRLLFNPAGGRAHHAFIAGRVEGTSDNSIGVTIFAGAAHGVREGATFSVYANQVDTDQEPLGYLEVTSKYQAVIKATKTKLNLPLDTSLPVVFFVVETGSLYRTLDICSGDVDISNIKHTSWNEVNEEKAKIVLKRVDGKVEVWWNAFPQNVLPPSVTNLSHNLSVPENNAADLLKGINNAAWFTHRISSEVNSSSYAFFDAEFKALDEDQETNGDNLLSSGVVSLDITQDNALNAYCLTLSNKTEHEIWPFVFICSPSDFSIRPWYTATRALPPKTAGTESVLEIGCGNEDNLAFQWNSELGLDIAYLKIIVTKERTSFAFLTQTEYTTCEKLREVSQPQAAPARSGEPLQKQGASSSSARNEWETMQIMITRKYVQRTSSPSSPSGSKYRPSFKGWTENVRYKFKK